MAASLHSLLRFSFRNLSLRVNRTAALGLAVLSATIGWAAPAPDPVLPGSYDLNSYGLITPVKDQEQLGTCWAFAMTTALQSSVLRQGLVSSPTSPDLNLSVWHLATANGNQNDLTPNAKGEYDGWGGFNEYAVGYWTRGRGQWELSPNAGALPAGGGPVLTSSNPLNAYPVDAINGKKNLAPYVPPASQPQTSFLVSQSVSLEWNDQLSDLSDFQDNLKAAVLEYGGLAVGVNAKNLKKTPDGQFVFYSPEGDQTVNHLVVLTGWDDDIQLTYGDQTFTGGWLVQNSWGAYGSPDPVNGDLGYIWVPYADVSSSNVKTATGLVTRSNVYEPTQQTFGPTVIQNQIFAPVAATGVDLIRRGYEEGVTSLSAEKQWIPSNSAIAAIGLWQGDEATKVDIRIYDNWGPNGPTGNLLGEKLSFTMNEEGAGYNLIDLDAPIFLAEGKPIYIVVDFGDGYDRPIIVDTRTVSVLRPEYGDYIGLSWSSRDGVHWDDLAAGEFDYTGAVFFMKVLRLQLDLDNSKGIDANFDFTVDGLIQTGPNGATNEILGLNFYDGAILNLNGPLTVTGGVFDVEDYYGTAIVQGDHTVTVTGDFSKMGYGTLLMSSDLDVFGNASIDEGDLFIGKGFAVGGILTVNGGQLNLLKGSTLSINEWVINQGEVDLGGQLSGVRTLTVNGGQLNVLDGAFLDTSALNVSGGVFNIMDGGVTRVDSLASVTQTGFLLVNGDLFAPQLVLAPNGYLGGSGQIYGNVINGGIVSPGNSPGTLTINGNFTQTSSGTLAIEIASPTVFDQLIVNGAASLAGTLAVSSYQGYSFQYGQTFQFLTADSITGTFDNITMPANFRGRFLADGGEGTLLVAPSSYTLVAANQNQQNVAQALDGFIPATSGDKLTVSTALDFLTASEYPAAFNAISPAFYESLANIGIEQAFSQGQQMQQRFRSVQLGARGFSESGLGVSAMSDKDGKPTIGPDGKAVKDIITPTEDNDWGVWVQGNGFFTRNTSVNDVPRYNFNSGGFLGGVDYRWNDAFATGLYAGYQGTYAKYDGGGTTTINGTRFGGYATYGKAEGFFANTMIGGGYSAYQVSRPIQFGSVDRTAKSRPDGGDFETMLNLGYNWQLGNFNLGVVGTGQYTYLGIAPFTENGADALDLSVDQQNANSIRTLLGGQAAYTWKVSPTLALIPQASLYWQHEFLENPRNIGASLDGGNGASFGYSTAAPARDSVYAGVGLTAQFGDRWNANVYYNANFGRQDFVSHLITTGLEFRW